jgi:cyclopropane-fatty-acyl-phospholipid synthase
MRRALAHPLLAPAPRLWAPLSWLARGVVVDAVVRGARGWRDERLDLRLPDGSTVRAGGGAGAGAAITVHDARAFTRVALRGELGAGEAYVAGEWDADDLPRALRLFLRATAARGIESPLTRASRVPALLRHRRAANDRAGSARNIAAHYDLGNAFYRHFLDDQLVYSCARWRDAATLEAAQAAKLAHLCELAAISDGDRVLELGCGWGALALEAARRGAAVTAVTVSAQQLAFARARAAAAPAVIAERVDLDLRDYRDTTGVHDVVLSCEMLEAVGEAYLPAFFATVAARLRRGGRAVIQSITMPDARYADYRRSVDWMQTYVFPGSHIPSLGAIRGAAAAAGLRLEHADDVGLDYPPTLRAWRQRFAAASAAVRALGFDEPFLRTWNLYLAFSEAAFAERTLGVHQLVFRRGRCQL